MRWLEIVIFLVACWGLNALMRRSRYLQAHAPQVLLCFVSITFLASAASVVVCPGTFHKLFSVAVSLFMLRFIVVMVQHLRTRQLAKHERFHAGKTVSGVDFRT